MPNRDFYPRNESQLLVWLETFINNLSVYSTQLGITPEQITQFQNYLVGVKDELNKVDNMKKGLQGAVKHKDEFLLEVEKRIRDTAVVIKRHVNYKTHMGEEMSIVAPDATQTVPLDDVKPVFTATAMSDQVRLDWSKFNFDGVNVHSKRGNETSFTFLGKDNRSPYEDERPNLVPDVPELRAYEMRYLIGDKEVGKWSDEVKVIVLI